MSAAGTNAVSDCLAVLHRQAYAQLIGSLTAFCGDMSAAEDAVQDAFAKALIHWTTVPEKPLPWLASTARNALVDRLRRQKRYQHKLQTFARETSIERAAFSEQIEPPEVKDEVLRLVFMCCHPAIDEPSRIALTLKILGGLSTQEIASAFLLPVSTMAQRLVRVKRKIRQAGIALKMPNSDDMEARVDSVLAIFYLIFNEGYVSTHSDSLDRRVLRIEAMRLTEQLLGVLPASSAASFDTKALLSLQLLIDARHEARVDSRGELLTLDEQDRRRWDKAQITKGLRLVNDVFNAGYGYRVYSLQAAIAALHARAATAADTDWAQIAELYGYLKQLAPSPIVSLNHAVAMGLNGELNDALDLLNALSGEAALKDYHLLYAARGDFLHRLGKLRESEQAYERAAALTQNKVEQRFIIKRMQSLAESAAS